MVIKLYKKIEDINISYIRYGAEDGKNIVLLHGWGQNIHMMRPIGDLLKKKYNITIIDLPGFGESEEPTTILTVYDYARIVNKLLISLDINKPIMLGHSFGGKIALVYASKYETSKLVLFGSPYDTEIKKMSLKTRILKSINKIPFVKRFEKITKKYMGSTDYRSASDMMRKVLTDTVNRSIEDDLSKIMIPTLIVWGSNDEAVPVEKAYRLEKLIHNAGLIVYDGSSHYAYLERLNQTIKVLKSFFESGE